MSIKAGVMSEIILIIHKEPGVISKGNDVIVGGRVAQQPMYWFFLPPHLFTSHITWL